MALRTGSPNLSGRRRKALIGLGTVMLALAVPVSADDPGNTVTFQGRPAARVIALPPLSRPGDVLHSTGPSDPVKGSFDHLLFQGKTDHGAAFEGSVDSGGGWGPWTEAELEVFSSRRFWGRIPVSGPAGSRVRLRVVQRGSLFSPSIEIYGIEASRETREHVTTVPVRVEPSTDAVKPEVRARGDWQALPPKGEYTPMAPVRITIHHTAGSRPRTLEEAREEVRFIQRFHQAGRGWLDVGYHFLIDGSGRIFQGRPENVVGAHVRGLNTGNVGISFMGYFHEPINNEPTKEQLDSALALARWLVRGYGIAPETLAGHRDFNATACPGDILYPRVGELREELLKPDPEQGPVAARLAELFELLGRVGGSVPFLGR